MVKKYISGTISSRAIIEILGRGSTTMSEAKYKPICIIYANKISHENGTLLYIYRVKDIV